MTSLWSKIKRKLGGASSSTTPAASERHPARATWVDPRDSPFDVPVLDLYAVLGQMISASEDSSCATRAISWSGSVGDELDPAPLDTLDPIACELRYPADPLLPDEGLLYTPTEMEHKWVLALRGDRLLAARSWTGQVMIVGAVERSAETLTVRELRILPDTGIESFGDPVEIVDWMIRSHALAQLVPIPVDPEGAAVLEGVPLSIFGLFGHKAVCAATSWSPPQPSRPLRADGRVLLAVRERDHAALRALAAAGASLDVPSPTEGYTPLLLAALRADLETLRLLLELGADPDRADDREISPLARVLVHGEELELLTALVDAGARTDCKNVDGFGLLHGAAECNRAAAISWLIAHGLDLEARTGHGHTALHIACALGHVEAGRALLLAGADIDACGPGGETVEDIARSEGKSGAVELLVSWRARPG